MLSGLVSSLWAGDGDVCHCLPPHPTIAVLASTDLRNLHPFVKFVFDTVILNQRIVADNCFRLFSGLRPEQQHSPSTLPPISRSSLVTCCRQLSDVSEVGGDVAIELRLGDDAALNFDKPRHGGRGLLVRAIASIEAKIFSTSQQLPQISTCLELHSNRERVLGNDSRQSLHNSVSWFRRNEE